MTIATIADRSAWLSGMDRAGKTRHHVISEWRKSGKSGPTPSAFKQWTIIHYAHIYGAETFVETGTGDGHTLAALRPFFNALYSIEPRAEAFPGHQANFGEDLAIHLIQGDSADELPKILHALKKAEATCLFWLDGKSMKRTVVRMDLESVLEWGRRAVVLVDDTCSFGGDTSAMRWLRGEALNAGYGVALEDSIIRLTHEDLETT